MASREAEEVEQPPRLFYFVDESDPDVLVLRRHDGSFVAAFSARGATREGIVETAEEDYRGLVRDHPSLTREAAEERLGA